MNKAGSIGSPGWTRSVARTRRSPLCNKQAKRGFDGEGFPGVQKHRRSTVRSALNPFHMDRLQPLVGAQSEVW
jgi:hypothetical protein